MFLHLVECILWMWPDCNDDAISHGECVCGISYGTYTSQRIIESSKMAFSNIACWLAVVFVLFSMAGAGAVVGINE